MKNPPKTNRSFPTDGTNQSSTGLPVVSTPCFPTESLSRLRSALACVNHQMKSSTAFILLFLFSIALPSWAQTIFNSGSTGADGALSFLDNPRQRSHMDLVYDEANNETILLDGWDKIKNTNMTDMQVWDGTNWQGKSSVNRPTGDYGYTIAFDGGRNNILLWGGIHKNRQTWTWDGNDWTRLTTNNQPTPYQYMKMIYDTARNEVVLFGGRINSTYYDQTWVWDGADWTQKNPVNKPSARAFHSLAYDSDVQRQEVVLFGGFNNSGFIFGDTWVWDGTNWQMKDNLAVSPSPRYDHEMVYDAVNKNVILFGGFDENGQELDDTWIWDGTAWAEKTPTNHPQKRRLFGMTYDTNAQEVVLFGGYYDGGKQLNDTWTWNGTEWTEKWANDPWERVVDTSEKADGTWNFTSINIPANRTVTFTPSPNPVIWLVQEDITVNGLVNLSGQNGVGAGTANQDPGNEAIGGPGGFPAGLGGRRFDVSGSFAGTAGQGPGGGRAGTTSEQDGGGGGYGAKGTNLGGDVYGNRLIDPIIGGSGGGGEASRNTSNGVNGGGGGGGILMATSGNAHINGEIRADGGAGACCWGGGGSGGSLKVIANRIDGSGNLFARGGGGQTGGIGRIRLEAFFVQVTGTITPIHSIGPPIELNLVTQEQIMITKIAGNVVPANPTGSTNTPDVIFQETGDVTIEMTTVNIPEGTSISVRITSSEQVLFGDAPVDANGVAIVTITVPAGVGTIQAFAEYTVGN